MDVRPRFRLWFVFAFVAIVAIAIFIVHEKGKLNLAREQFRLVSAAEEAGMVLRSKVAEASIELFKAESKSPLVGKKAALQNHIERLKYMLHHAEAYAWHDGSDRQRQQRKRDSDMMRNLIEQAEKDMAP